MIPASYLYKDAYRQAWIEPDIECAKARAATHRDGHHIWDDLTDLLSRLALRQPNIRQSHATLAAYDCA